MSQALIVRCPACGSRLRVQGERDLPARFKVRCSTCQKPFLVRRKEATGDPDSILEQTLTGEPAPAPAGGDSQQTRVTGPSPSGPVSPPPVAGPTSAAASGPVPPRSAASPRPATGPAPLLPPTMAPPARPATGSRPTATTGPATTTGGSPGPRGGQTFSPGEIVAGRYRIDRFIAKGGMGEVYEAFDSALGDSVALKTVRPDMASDESAVERFRREVHLARQVTHRNVCRIHDIGAHRSESPLAALYPNGEILFVTMELLRGENLADRLERLGAMEPEQALPLVRQMAAALDAAHAAGVIHRDFKCANVVLENPEPLSHGGSEKGEPRVVVTDFGLARGGRGGGRDSSGVGGTANTLTVAGSVMGSPAYMAPEQVEGLPSTTAVDIYAFGVVIFEMVTGKLPFKGESPLSTAIKRLTEAPPKPSEVKPGVPPRWDEAILRCLARQPGGRFGKAGDVVAALDPSLIAAALGTSSLTRRRLVGAVAAGFLIALALVVNFVVWRKRATAEDAMVGQRIEARPAVAVLGLKNTTGDAQLEWLSNGLPEMLTSELASGGAIRLIPGENVARAQLELGLDPGASWGSDVLAKVRRNLGSDYVVTGSYTAVGDGASGQLRLDLRLQDTMTVANTSTVAVTGPRGEVFNLVAQAGGKLREALHLAASGKSWQGGNPEAAPLYVEGLERLRKFDARGARELLEKAVAVDANDPRSQAALANAYAALGYGELAKTTGQRAVELSGPLPEMERQEIRAQYLELAGDWAGATEAWNQLWQKYPDDLEFGLHVAQATVAAGQPARALEVAKALRRLPSAAADDVRIYFAEATAAGALGQFREQEQAAAKAAEVALAQGARLLRARALLLDGWALRNLGDSERAQGVTSEAEGLFQQAGDASGVAKARVQRASLLFDQGDLDTARKLFEQALATYRELGDKGNEAQALNNLALVLKQRGDVATALGLYEQSLKLSQETGNRLGMANAGNNIGALKRKRGELTEALAAFQNALELSRAIGDKNQQGYSLFNVAVTLRHQGKLEEAEARHREALTLRREIGQRLGEAASLVDLGAVQNDRGDVRAAGTSYQQALDLAKQITNRRLEAAALAGLGQVRMLEGKLDEADQLGRQALAIRQELGEKGTEAESQLALAVVALERGQFREAEELSKSAAQRFDADGSSDLAAWARAVRARSMIFLGRQQEGLDLATQALQRATKSEDLRVRCEAQLAASRVLAAVGRAPQADTLAATAASEAEKAGLMPVALEAKLLQGQLESERGRPDAATALAMEVRSRAERSGLELLARKASSR